MAELTDENRCQARPVYVTLDSLAACRNKKNWVEKIFIAEKQETSYYRFCGYGNYENTYLFVH